MLWIDLVIVISHCKCLDIVIFTNNAITAAIGARTTESQIHRELASGMSMPVGFKV